MRQQARRASAALLLGCVLLVASSVAAVASGGRGSKASPALPGWVVDRVRFEPVPEPGRAAVPLSVDGLGSYRGALQMVPSDGGVAVIDQLGLDEYLRGLSEIPTTWPAEALQAQVIAARTYALYGVVSGTKNAVHALGADICATDSCQVYRGMTREQDSNADAWNAAVAATSGQVLLYRGGVIFAEYSSSNGGQSVSGGVPWLPSVADPDDATSPLHHWRVSIPFADLSRIFSTPAPVTGASRQGDSVVLTWQQPDGSQGSSASAVADFRVRLDTQQAAPAGMPETVPSGRFTVVVDGPSNSVVLEGGGWGHGVGMSQYGAMGKALRGMRAADILASYYGGLRPVTLPPAQLPSSIRVALDLGRPEAVVGGGRFRLLDGAGHVLAVAAHGSWSVVPGPKGGTVRVVPPADQTGPPALALTTVEPGPTVAPGAPVRLGLQLSAPAFVRVVATPPGGATTVADLGLLEPGPVALPLAAAAGRGTYAVRVEADAGGGRQAVLPVAIGVADPTAQAPPRGGEARSRVEASGDSPATAGVALGRSAATTPVSRLPMWLLELASCAVVATAAVLSPAFHRRRRRGVSETE